MDFSKVLIGFEFEFTSRFDTFEKLKEKLAFDLDILFSGKKAVKWKCVWDGSIKADSGFYASEVVSPPMLYDDAIVILQRFFDWMIYNKCRTNTTTGLHISINFTDAELNKKIDPVKLIMLAPEMEMLKQFKRQRNVYCLTYKNDLQNWSVNFNKGIELKEAAKFFKQKMCRTRSKYKSINVSKLTRMKYVEFRVLGNRNYHKRFDEVLENINKMCNSVLISADDTLCVDEYKLAMQPYIPAFEGQMINTFA